MRGRDFATLSTDPAAIREALEGARTGVAAAQGTAAGSTDLHELLARFALDGAQPRLVAFGSSEPNESITGAAIDDDSLLGG